MTFLLCEVQIRVVLNVFFARAFKFYVVGSYVRGACDLPSFMDIYHHYNAFKFILKSILISYPLILVSV